MAHDALDFTGLKGKVQGFSDKLIDAHLGLYKGYVTKLNEIEGALKEADRGAPNYSYNAYSELRRREAIALNGTVLHELYFEALTAPGTKPSGALADAINAAFGSYDAWLKDARACSTSTHAWVLVTKSYVDGALHNYMLHGEHHIGVPVHQKVIVALDLWEHAYHIDYATSKPGYLDALFAAIDWNKAGERWDKVK